MKHSSKTWLFFMLVPFIIGVFIHFLIPLQFILTTNPKIESVYNTYKIEIEQDTIRANSLQNGKIFENHLQMYQNIRSNFIRILRNPKKYEEINMNQISFNSASELANMNQSELMNQNLNKSMWYISGVVSLSQMDEVYRRMYRDLIQAEPFLLAILSGNSPIYDAFQSLFTILKEQNHTFYLQYPSEVIQNLSENVMDKIDERYAATIFNYNVNKIQETIFVHNENLDLCQPLLLNNETIGINCMELNLQIFTEFLGNKLIVPEFQLSDNEYYIVKPKYNGIDPLDNPKIIMNFSQNNFESIDFPENETFDLPKCLSPSIFSSNQNFQFFIYRFLRTNAYYILPISILDYNDQRTNDMYVILQNNFANADLNFENREKHMLIIMILPSIVMLLISIIVTVCILRWLLNNLNLAIRILNDFCSLILKGDTGLNIPTEKYTEDLNQLFQQFHILNELHKYSDPKFFDVPKPQRIIKYLKCLKLFDRLSYDKGNLCENIADCYGQMGQFHNSVKYMQVSVDASIQILEQKEGNIDLLFERKVKKQKVSTSTRRLEKILRRRLNKLVHFTYYTYIYGDKSSDNFHRIMANVDLLKKITYPKIINMEYLASMMIQLRLMYQTGVTDQMAENLNRLGSLLSAYEDQYYYQFEDTEDRKPSPDVLRGYWWFIKGELFLAEKKIMEAYRHYVESLSHDLYHPHLHVVAQNDLKKMLEDQGINLDCFNEMFYQRNYQKRTDREYMFLMDASRPDISDEQLRQWKKCARELIECIYNGFIKGDDRISIVEYCNDLKVSVSLTHKKSQEKLLKKQLLNSIKTRAHYSTPNTIECLSRATKRIAHLYQQKYFILFVKPGVYIDGPELIELAKQVPNSQFIIVLEKSEFVIDHIEGFFVIDFETGLKDLERILEDKAYKPADNSIYVF